MRALKVLRESCGAIRARVEGEVRGLIEADSSCEGLVRAAERAERALDEEGERALARSRMHAPACSAGCKYCCHVHAEATAPEIMVIAARFARSMDEEGLRAARERLSRQASLTERLTSEERWALRIPCALLGEDGRCTIYEVRPLRCRAFHSASVEPCREAFEGREDHEPLTNLLLLQAHDAVEEGYDAALAGAGFSAEGYRLEVGLLVALEDPGAFARWVSGEAFVIRC